MTKAPATDVLRDGLARDVSKVRKCLRCKATFPSKWSGERICARCKSSNSWRNGMPFRPYADTNR